jgi:hypothetical protein
MFPTVFEPGIVALRGDLPLPNSVRSRLGNKDDGLLVILLYPI